MSHESPNVNYLDARQVDDPLEIPRINEIEPQTGGDVVDITLFDIDTLANGLPEIQKRQIGAKALQSHYDLAV